MFGINIDGVEPGQEVVIDESVFGYPFDSLKDLQAGDYFVQALLHKYETFELANGKTVQLISATRVSPFPDLSAE